MIAVARDLRLAIIERDQRACHYCGARSASATHGPDGRPWGTDHKVPRSRGGTDDPANMVLCCATCNGRKATALVDEPWQDRWALRQRLKLLRRQRTMVQLRALHRRHAIQEEERLALAAVDAEIADAKRALDAVLVTFKTGPRPAKGVKLLEIAPSNEVAP